MTTSLRLCGTVCAVERCFCHKYRLQLFKCFSCLSKEGSIAGDFHLQFWYVFCVNAVIMLICAELIVSCCPMWIYGLRDVNPLAWLALITLADHLVVGARLAACVLCSRRCRPTCRWDVAVYAYVFGFGCIGCV